MTKTVIAIDGPAGSGKSTVAMGLSERLNLPYLDTGSMYRALALSAVEADVDVEDQAALLNLLAAINLEWTGREILLEGQPLGGRIRSDQVSEAASKVARHPLVRTWMAGRQRSAVQQRPEGAVVDGRDISTVVLPDADLKIFLTADVAERARRRAVDDGVSLDSSRAAVQIRDDRDTGRAAAPLKIDADARVIDTTNLSAEQVVDLIEDLVKERTP